MGSAALAPDASTARRLLPWLVPFAAMAWTLLAQGRLLGQDVDFVVRHVTIDDTYYYLNTAWNTRQLGWVTFDGVNPTNGVQFLWFWLLWLASYLFESKATYLHGALWLAAAFGATATLVAWRLGALLAGWMGGALLAGFVAHGAADVTHLRGLENTVHLFVFLLAADQFLRLRHDLRARPAVAPRRFVVLCALLSLNAWARLDAGAASAALALHAAWSLLRAPGVPPDRRVRATTAGLALAAVAGAIQLFGFWRMGGSLVPVSGLWKTATTSAADLPALLWHWWGRPLAWTSPVADAAPEDLVSALAAALTALALVAPWLGRTKRSPERQALLVGVAVVALALLVHAVCMAAMVDAVALRRGTWYQAPHLALMATLSVLPFALLRGAAGAMPRWVPAALGVATVLTLAWLLRAADANARKYVATRSGRTNFHGARLEVARWIDANLAPDARIGSFNSGELGYFSGRPTTNLDGLINSFAYRAYRLAGGTVAEYLRTEGIDYFVDYQFDAGIRETTEPVHSHPVPNREPIEVRRVVRAQAGGR